MEDRDRKQEVFEAKDMKAEIAVKNHYNNLCMNEDAEQGVAVGIEGRAWKRERPQ